MAKRGSRKCQFCGEPIPESRRSNAIFCSVACGNKGRHRKRDETRKAKRESLRCVVCGRKLDVLNGDAKYCGSVCKSRARTAKDPAEAKERFRRGAIARRYGMTLEEYDERVSARGGGCAICGKVPAPGKRRLHVDHDHETGMNRDLLCHGCNVGLGNFEENPERLEAAAQYLRQWAAMASLLKKSKGDG